MYFDNFYRRLENNPKIRNAVLIIIDSIFFLIIPNLSLDFLGILTDKSIYINLVFLIVGIIVFIFTVLYIKILDNWPTNLSLLSLPSLPI